jgi:hypothetical protein
MGRGRGLFLGWLGGLGPEKVKQWQNNSRTIEKQRKTIHKQRQTMKNNKKQRQTIENKTQTTKNNATI